jgi:hypothetical protein
MKAYGDLFLTSAIIVASRLGGFFPGERAPGTYWIGGWVDSRTCLDDVENRKISPLKGLELRPLCRPARSQSLYRLRYPSVFLKKKSEENKLSVNSNHYYGRNPIYWKK